VSAGEQLSLAASGHFHVRQWAVFHVRRQSAKATGLSDFDDEAGYRLVSAAVALEPKPEHGQVLRLSFSERDNYCRATTIYEDTKVDCLVQRLRGASRQTTSDRGISAEGSSEFVDLVASCRSEIRNRQSANRPGRLPVGHPTIVALRPSPAGSTTPGGKNPGHLPIARA
jgi:hypothetical protein